MGISRSAVWKQIRTLESLGVEVFSVRGRGYRIPGGLDLLSMERIHASLSSESQSWLEEVEITLNTGSTNQLAADALRRGVHRGLYVSEQQTQGRGRRGRSWESPFAANLYFSLAWRFTRGLSALEGVSLAVAVALQETLLALGADQVRVKWPNDLLAAGSKLGGILIEVAGDTSSESQVVIGVGVNVCMPEQAAQRIDQRWSDVRQQGVICGRNALLAQLVNGLVEALQQFEQGGFAAFRERWASADAFMGRRVRVASAAQVQEGVYAGIDAQGALLLDTEEGRLVLHGGELSLRGVSE